MDRKTYNHLSFWDCADFSVSLMLTSPYIYIYISMRCACYSFHHKIFFEIAVCDRFHVYDVDTQFHNAEVKVYILMISLVFFFFS